MITPEACGNGGDFAEDRTTTKAVVDLDGLSFVGGSPYGSSVHNGQIK